MFVVGWAILGWLVGISLEQGARFFARETQPVCASCGMIEPGPPSAMLRAFGRAGKRCPGCGAFSIWWLVALGPTLAAAHAVLATRWPLGAELLAASFYTAVLLLVAVLDLRRRLVYPLLTYPATALAIVLTPAAFHQPFWSGAVGAAIGAGVFALFYIGALALYRSSHGLGLGDVMIAGMVGAMTGLSSLAPALFIGTLLGGLAAVAIGLVTRSRRANFAYGPALCLGGFLALLLGSPQ